MAGQVIAKSITAEVDDARAYWNKYVWHHRDWRTRALHRVGTTICLLGMFATVAGGHWAWLPLSLATGYLFAFAGHYLVEGNRPLTFRSPIRAGIANWVMFFYEMFYDVELDIARLALAPPDVSDVDDT